MLPRIIQQWTMPLRRLVRQRQAAQHLSTLDDPILIYQMSKVGSRSVKEALEKAEIPALHIHFLTNINQRLQDHVEKRAPIPEHFWTSCALRPRLDQQRWRIITLVRDPVARALSGYFQVPDLTDVDLSSYERAWKTVVKDKLHNNDFSYPSRWFEKELHQVFDIDAMDHPFNREEGYARIEAERCDLLVCQMEQLTTLIPTVISDFVGQPLEPMHTGARSESMYQAIKEEAYLPADVLNRVYSSEFMQHFYAPAQIDTFRKRWRRSNEIPQPQYVHNGTPQG